MYDIEQCSGIILALGGIIAVLCIALSIALFALSRREPLIRTEKDLSQHKVEEN